MKITCGLDNLITHQRHLLADRRIGIVAHPASVTSSLEHILPTLRRAGARVEALFGPEHGFGGEAQDMEPVAAPITGPAGIPLYSLYGAEESSLSPSAEAVSGLDALVVDLFDVGARYYTFVWTAVLCLRVCHRVGTPLILLDRPNPLNGVTVEGAPGNSGFLSFVGLLPVPNRHGLTVGEIATMAARLEHLEDALTVVSMAGWQRDMYFDETGLPFVMPSPNMPTLDTALVYPGACLLEATWCSEGRGTTRPFEFTGAPGLDGDGLCRLLNEQQLPGAFFRPASFKPMFQKHAGRLCAGAQLHVRDRSVFEPYRTGVALLWALRRIAGASFRWREAPYEFVTDIPAIDLLCGNARVRQMLEDGADPDDIRASWQAGQREFEAVKADFHLY